VAVADGEWVEDVLDDVEGVDVPAKVQHPQQRLATLNIHENPLAIALTCTRDAT